MVRAEGRTYRPGMRQRAYALESVTAPAGVPGSLRGARKTDRHLMVDWMLAFEAEAMAAGAGWRDMRKLVDDMLTQSSRTGYIWEVNGKPVSMCQATGATPARDPDRRRVHAAGASPPRLRQCARGGREPGGAGPWAALVLPVHGPGQPHLEPHLSRRSATARSGTSCCSFSTALDADRGPSSGPRKSG